MSEPRYIALDLMRTINEAVSKGLATDDPVAYGEILYALEVCAAVIAGDIPEDRRQDYINAHMLGLAKMLGVPLIATEVEMPDKEAMN